MGLPIPDSPHACLVSLPTWDAVIGYEEGHADVVGKIRAGYPRFFVHPLTWKLFEELERRVAGEGERVVAYSSAAAAQRAGRFVERRTGSPVRCELVDGMPVLIVPRSSYQAARDYWRHTGEIVSSRQAEDILAGTTRQRGEEVAQFRTGMAQTMKVEREDCFVLESGMAAIFALYRVVTSRRPGKKTLQLCFPYVDALKVQEHFGSGVDFVRSTGGEQFREALERIRGGEYAAVFCEAPSNPLLQTVDLHAVSAVCRESRTPLLVDDTICSHANVEVLPWADAVSTSLTKWVSGIGDVMAGAAKINRDSPLADEFRAALDAEIPEGSLLYGRDAEVLQANARGFEERVAASNAGGEEVAEFLAGHSAIERVWYPKFVDRANYDALRRPGCGYGGLLSFTLKIPARAPAVYEALRFSKGPSLGTEYSLICPYTLLAHYTELKWAEECGVPRELLRLSVGREPVAELRARLEEALALG